MVGSILGVLFISLVRRGMVEDPELPFPESLAASEIHKAGQRGAQAAKYLFWNIGIGGVVYILGKFGLFAADTDLHIGVGSLGRSQVRLGTAGSTHVVAAGGTSVFAAPSVSPAYLGVGYIIGVRLASIQFAGSVLAWGLMVPLLIFFLGPQLKQYIPADTPDNWATMADAVWRYIVRPIAVGGMLVGAAYTLFKMRASLTAGIGKAFADLRQTADEQAKLARTERYMSSKIVFGLIARDVCSDVPALHQNFGLVLPGDSGGGGDDAGGIFLRHSVGQSGRIYRIVEQSNFRFDAVDAADRGAADGRAGSFRRLGSGGGAGRGGGGLCFVGGRRRTTAGL